MSENQERNDIRADEPPPLPPKAAISEPPPFPPGFAKTSSAAPSSTATRMPFLATCAVSPSPPPTQSSGISALSPAPPLWNPKWLGAWSLLFSWAFGAFLLARNWKSLGNASRATRCMIWFYACFAFALAATLMPSLASGNLAVLGVFYLLEVWPQAKLVKERFGDQFPRKPWGKPVAIATGICGSVLLLVIAGNDNKDASTAATSVPRPIAQISWQEIASLYGVNSGVTNLRKDEEWKKYRGKIVQWEGQVTDIAQGFFGGIRLSIRMDPKTFTSDLLIDLKGDQKSKALQVQKGDTVIFKGILDEWGTFVPITLTDGEIVGGDTSQYPRRSGAYREGYAIGNKWALKTRRATEVGGGYVGPDEAKELEDVERLAASVGDKNVGIPYPKGSTEREDWVQGYREGTRDGFK